MKFFKKDSFDSNGNPVEDTLKNKAFATGVGKETAEEVGVWEEYYARTGFLFEPLFTVALYVFEEDFKKKKLIWSKTVNHKGEVKELFQLNPSVGACFQMTPEEVLREVTVQLIESRDPSYPAEVFSENEKYGRQCYYGDVYER